MHGVLADINVQGHLSRLRQMLEKFDLWSILADLNLKFATFPDLSLGFDLEDRSLWNFCQQEGWVLFTENRNKEDENSLEATIRDSWVAGCLPILTLANKDKFEHDSEYATRVANDVADLMFGIAQGEFCDQPRIFVPRR